MKARGITVEFRKRKKGFGRRRRKFNGLELTIEDNKGKASTYLVRYGRKRTAANRNSSIVQVKRYRRCPFWKIEDKSINIDVPETLIDKKIVLKRGNSRVVGIVRNVSVSYKSPEGEPVPVPPPPRP